jgi:hypothetical protein
VAKIQIRTKISVLPLPVGTGQPRPPLSKNSIDFDHEIMENEKKYGSDSDHEIMNLVEKNVGTPAILGRAPQDMMMMNFQKLMFFR